MRVPNKNLELGNFPGQESMLGPVETVSTRTRVENLAFSTKKQPISTQYQGMGAGTLLMDSMKVLAQRTHLSRVWLSVFEGNTPAQRLYRRSGFEESGSIPGYLQEGYVNENFMTLKLD